jgi:hypothetical protein
MDIDSTGKRVSHRFTQAASLTSVGQFNRRTWVCSLGPFFSDSLTVTANIASDPSGEFQTGTTTLVKWKDYFPCFYFDEATLATGIPVYGGIVVFNNTFVGQISVSGQLLGGEFLASAGTVSQYLSQETMDPINLSFSPNLSNGNVFVNGFRAEITSDDNATFSDVVSELALIPNALSSSYELKTVLDFFRHINDDANSHGITAQQLQLDLVPNWSVASSSDVASGTGSPKFVTPALAALAVGSRANVPEATASSAGTFRLNDGSNPASDASNAEKALTASGLLTLIQTAVSNPVKLLFDVERSKVSFTQTGSGQTAVDNGPLFFPCTCLGVVCNNFDDMVTTVSNHLKLSGMQSSKKYKCVWLPRSFTKPSISIY